MPDCVSCYKKSVKEIFDGDVVHYAVFMFKWRDGPGCEICGSRSCIHWDYHTAECTGQTWEGEGGAAE